VPLTRHGTSSGTVTDVREHSGAGLVGRLTVHADRSNWSRSALPFITTTILIVRLSPASRRGRTAVVHGPGRYVFAETSPLSGDRGGGCVRRPGANHCRSARTPSDHVARRAGLELREREYGLPRWPRAA